MKARGKLNGKYVTNTFTADNIESAKQKAAKLYVNSVKRYATTESKSKKCPSGYTYYPNGFEELYLNTIKNIEIETK
jgi:hypothetical protein